MAAHPHTDGDQRTVLMANLGKTYNVLEAAHRAEFEPFVFLWTNHLMNLFGT